MLERRSTYPALYADFRWDIPDRFNIGTAIADAWAAREPDRVALLEYRTEGAPRTLTYGELARQSDALAAGLRRQGIRRGDRVALLLPQCFETAIAHAAIYKLGAIAVPLALLFGVEALEYRLQTAGVRAVVTNAAGLAKLGAIQARLPSLEAIVSIDGADGGAAGFPAPGRRPCGGRLRGRADARRRPGDDDLHLRHDRPAQGRAARPSGAARPPAGRPDAARVPAAAA